MYGLLRFFVRAEETWLEETFQDRYRAYRRRIPAVLPLPRFWLRSEKQ
jgi:protein-S-isoprenylcysteine O-methyltransferase Ste14